jgi:hypothetical protein
LLNLDINRFHLPSFFWFLLPSASAKFFHFDRSFCKVAMVLSKRTFPTSIFFLARLIRLNGIPFLSYFKVKELPAWPKANLYKVPDFSSNIMLALVAKAIHLLEALD